MREKHYNFLLDYKEYFTLHTEIQSINRLIQINIFILFFIAVSPICPVFHSTTSKPKIEIDGSFHLWFR